MRLHMLARYHMFCYISAVSNDSITKTSNSARVLLKELLSGLYFGGICCCNWATVELDNPMRGMRVLLDTITL
jgi:hypothetical protein